MRKFLLLFSLLLTVGIASATTAKVTFSESGYTNAQVVSSLKVGDIDVTFDKANATTATTYYTTGGMRAYQGSTITLKAPEGQNLTQIVFTAASNYGIATGTTASTGTFTVASPAEGVWTGEANEVVITVKAVSKHWRWSDLEVTYEGGSAVVDPDPEPEPEPDPEPTESNAVVFYAQGYNYTGTASPTVEVSGTLTPSTAGEHGTAFTAADVCSIDWVKQNNSNSNVTDGLIRWYKDDKLYVYPVAGVTINKVTIKCGTGYKGLTLTADDGAFTEDTSALTYTWTGSATSTLTIWASAQIRVQYIEIEYTKDESVEVIAAPTIELGENNTVTLSQADGLEIRYTLDGSEPTAESTLYTAPFTISEATTVKAVAVKNGNLSSVNTKKLYPNNLSSLAQFLSVQPATAAKINTPLTAIYQCGRNLYLTDGTDYILAYNSNNVEAISNLAAQNGDVISFISGSYKSQNGLPEIIATEVGEKTAGTPVDPYEVAIEEVATDMLNKYVVIYDVNITAAEKANNYTANDGTGEIVIYNTFNNATNYPEAITLPDGTKGNTVPEGEGFTVYGFVSCYNSTLQINPIRIEGGKVMETVATPVFTPASGSELSAGDQITIECETEGATIYVAFDGEEPTTESMVYTNALTFSEACTIKAMAVKDGMLNSDVATATYTLYVAGSAKAVFDFTDAEKLLAQVEIGTIEAAPESGKGVSLNEITLKEGPVALAFDRGENTNNTTQWWNYAGENRGLECRPYNKNELNVSLVEDGYRITKISFEQNSGSTNWGTLGLTTNLGTVDGEGGTWVNADKIYTAPAEGLVNFVQFIPEANVRFSKMIVEYVQDDNGVQGIEEVGTDNADALVEFFNLQGIRVAADNLTPGIYVRRQGTEVVKVLVK